MKEKTLQSQPPVFTPIDPAGLDIVSNERDLLRDLFTYLDYVRDRSIKRMTRTNEIPRGDMQRLAKLLDIAPPDENDEFSKYWIYFIDGLALRMNLVRYDAKGEYRGESSSEPSFVGNYITVDAANYEKFLNLAPAEQEKSILGELINVKSVRDYDSYGNNEFYQSSIVGRLDTFSPRGSGVGIMPTLQFPQARLFLLKILQSGQPGQWRDTNSLIAYLKTDHPFFLIPQNAPKTDRWGGKTGRYDNFYEGKDHWNADKTVPPDDPDAFERVEGRYVERFLEYIPLLMRFVDVAYDPKPYTGLAPSRGILKAFRVNERFLRLMKGESTAPKVTVQPNFDVVIESDFYPAAIIRQISALGELVSSPNSGHGAYVGIFQLKKTLVAAEQVRQPNLDVIDLLKKLGGRDLPSNVLIELDEWIGHADQFTLYEGFALLETAAGLAKVEKLVAEKISPTLRLVRAPSVVFSTLETLGHVPLRIQHLGKEFTPVAESATSVFPKEPVWVETPKVAKPVKVNRVVTVSYRFPEAEAFESVQKMLAELRCPFHADPTTRIVSIQQKEQPKFDEALQKLAADFAIEIE